MSEANAYRQYFSGIYGYLSRLAPFSEADFRAMEPYFEIRKFGRKENVLNAGEIENYFNIIMEGLVRKYIVAKKKEVTLQLSGKGHFIQAEVSFNQRTPAVCIVETIEPSILFSVSFDNLEEIYRRFPGMEKLGRLLVTEMFLKKDERDVNHLRKTARERFLDYMANHPDMVRRVPQKYLASYLGIKPETFSRLKHLLMQPRENPVKD